MSRDDRQLFRWVDVLILLPLALIILLTICCMQRADPPKAPDPDVCFRPIDGECVLHSPSERAGAMPVTPGGR